MINPVEHAPISARRKRGSLPPIHRDPAQQNLMPATMAAEDVWGQRAKDARAELLSLCGAERLRNSFPRQGVKCVERIVNLLSDAKVIVHKQRADMSPVLSFLTPRVGEVTCTQLLMELDNVYKPCLKYLMDAGFMSDEQRQEMGMVNSLTDVVQENRPMYQLVGSIESYIKVHAAAPEAERRQVSVLFGFVARAMRALTPARVRGPINACLLCHRHDVERLVCSRHLDDGRITASTTQRARFQQALELGEQRMASAAKANEQLLKELASMEIDGKLHHGDVQRAFNALFADPVNGGLVDLPMLWQSALDSVPASAASLPAPIARAWYGLDLVDDPVGVNRLNLPVSSVLFKLMTDVSRFDCFVASGGEIPRQRRKRSASKHPKA